MSPETGSPRRGRWRVAGAVLGVLLLIGGGIAATLVLSRSRGGEPTGLCEIAANDAYAARVDAILAGYHAAAEKPEFDAGMQVGNAAEYGFTPLFQMQACSIEESDLSGRISDQGGTYYGLRQIIYDPEFRGGQWLGTPIDIEVAWYDELGVEGLIGGWSTIARLDRDGVVGELQRLLSLGLTHVTNPDRDTVLDAGVYPDFLVDKDRYLADGYVDAFIDLGGQSVELARYEPLGWGRDAFGGDYLLDDPDEWELVDTGPRVYGWSVLAPLLRFGEFHEQFLTPVATAIIEFDQQRNGDWRIEGEEAVSFDAFDGDPTNAMDAVLEALARNPTAAAAVFEATGDPRVQNLLGDG
jgi:hypothetical protein